jgi:hypothetical protein
MNDPAQYSGERQMIHSSEERKETAHASRARPSLYALTFEFVSVVELLLFIIFAPNFAVEVEWRSSDDMFVIVETPRSPSLRRPSEKGKRDFYLSSQVSRVKSI